MNFTIRNTDILDPQELAEKALGQTYFADTKVCRSVGMLPDGELFVRFIELEKAMQRGVLIPCFAFTFSKTLEGHSLCRALDDVLGRFPRNSDVVKFLLRHSWEKNPEGSVQSPYLDFVLSKDVTITRYEHDGDGIWSPFYRAAPVLDVTGPLNRDRFVRMLMCGQFEELSHVANGIGGDKTVSIRQLCTGQDCAARIVRSAHLNWKFAYEGAFAVASSIGTHGTERIAFQPALY